MYSDIKPIVLPRDEYILEREYRATGKLPRRGYMLESAYRSIDGGREITYLDKTQFILDKNYKVVEIIKLSDKEFSNIVNGLGFKLEDIILCDEDL